jgi:hypothetical protein
MTTVATCSNPAEAMLIKTLLEGSGITAYVPGELTAQSAVNFAGDGIRVEVDAENYEVAKKILADVEDAASKTDSADAGDQPDPAR